MRGITNIRNGAVKPPVRYLKLVEIISLYKFFFLNKLKGMIKVKDIDTNLKICKTIFFLFQQLATYLYT